MPVPAELIVRRKLKRTRLCAERDPEERQDLINLLEHLYVELRGLKAEVTKRRLERAVFNQVIEEQGLRAMETGTMVQFLNNFCSMSN